MIPTAMLVKALPHGGEFRQRLAIAPAEVLFVHQIAVPYDKQTAVLAGLLHVVECGVEFIGVHSAGLLYLDRVLEHAPASFCIRRRVVRLGGHQRLRSGQTRQRQPHASTPVRGPVLSAKRSTGVPKAFSTETHRFESGVSSG